jgi:hypothetical protein
MSITSYSQCNDSLKVIIDIPFPIAKATKNDTAFCGSALDSIKARIPNAEIVKIPFNMDLTDSTDWLAVMDVCQARNIKAIIGFADPNIADVFRPDTLTGGQWDLKDLAEFASCYSCVNHPALYALNITDEPWEWGIRGYFSYELVQIYDILKTLAAPSQLNLYLNFSREIWKIHYSGDGLGGQGPNSQVYWRDSICDIVQISTLEFQDSVFNRATLDSNHYYSRKIINYYTPNFPIYTSVQVFGQNYGPASGSWFPQGDSLTAMLDLLTDTKYQSELPLTGFIFQKWDASDLVDRPNQFTLGDATFSGSPANQIAASNEAIQAIIDWFQPCITSINELTLKSSNFFSIYPNPGDNNVWLEISDQVSSFDIAIIDMQGKTVKKKEGIKSTKIELPNNLDSGTYFVVVRTQSGKIGSKKMIIK